ncbi:uncharacterized protein [Neodiprion pinetum]|uniref:uncharacterized protein n=1 Tax=Neodiprion pinetum TaxID=441929 RepID=UPI00076FBBA9|nr:uncharacterized protein LOC124215408 [Neodiprion pinetum]
MTSEMDEKNCFVKYSLSASSMDRLNPIRDQSMHQTSEMKNAWRIISWVEPEQITVEEDDKDNVQATVNRAISSQDGISESIQATQYGFTQVERSGSTFGSICSIENFADYLYESLECANGKLEVDHIHNITDSELSSIVNDLSKKLSYKGIYNLCHSVCGMDMKLSERLISLLCKNILLTAIISIEEPSRLLNAAITECVGKFPEDVENLVFIPSLNSDLKEITTILSITSSLDNQQKRAYISDFSTKVKDLKQWHILVLQDLVVANIDDNIKEKVLGLLWKKSYDFSRDKNYGKLILSILKTNPPTTVQQQHFYEEIVADHNTLFKKLMAKMLESNSVV